MSLASFAAAGRRSWMISRQRPPPCGTVSTLAIAAARNAGFTTRAWHDGRHLRCAETGGSTYQAKPAAGANRYGECLIVRTAEWVGLAAGG